MRFPRRHLHLCACVAFLLALWSCKNSEDQAAKERVFSPPPPNPILEKAKEPVDLAKLEQDKDYRRKVLGMLFPEVQARLKAGLFTVKETLTIQKGEQSISVEENGQIQFNSHGDMAVELKTGPTEAMQLVYTNEVLYLRNRAGQWRASRDPSDERHFWANETYGALRTTADLFKDAMTFKRVGPEEIEGRKASRFELGLSQSGGDPDVLTDPEDGGPQTTVRIPDGGALFRAAQDHRRALKGGVPQSLTGYIIFDDEKGVPLKVELEGTLKLGGKRTTDIKAMTIKLESSVVDVGKDQEILPPKGAVAEIIRRRIPVSPLEFLDGGTTPAKGKPAQKGEKDKAPAQPVEPPDDTEE
ncbi:MAG: hypothetical protein AB2A00_29875 [Myxococcota bacterium]